MSYRVMRFAINDVEWTPIVAPKDSSFFGLTDINGVDCLLRIDKDDAATEWPLAGGMQESVVVPNSHMSLGKGVRWSAGDTILWVKSAVPGTSTVVLKMP